jgi:hypothetical protein
MKKWAQHIGMTPIKKNDIVRATQNTDKKRTYQL